MPASERGMRTILCTTHQEVSAWVGLKPQGAVLCRPVWLRQGHRWVGAAGGVDLLALVHRDGHVALVPAAQGRAHVTGKQVGAAAAPNGAHVRVQRPVPRHIPLHLRDHQRISQAACSSGRWVKSMQVWVHEWQAYACVSACPERCLYTLWGNSSAQ